MKRQNASAQTTQARFAKGKQMRYQYSFAEKCVEVCSELLLTEDRNSALFRSSQETSPNLRIILKRSQNLSAVYSEMIWQSEFFRLLHSGESQLIQTLDRRDGHPLMEAVFSLHSPEVTLWVREDFPPELARMQQIWQAVSLPSQLMRYGVLSLHSASVLTDNGVILFCGRSGVGKSTQAEMWRVYENASVLNGDRNALTVTKNGAIAHGLPFCGTSGICRSYDLPLRAVVALEQSDENAIRRLGGIDALQALIGNALGLLPGDSSIARWELFSAAAHHVPVYHLACTPDNRAVRLLKTTLEEGN